MRRERGRKTNCTFLSRNIGPLVFLSPKQKDLSGVEGCPQGLLSGCSPWPGKSLWKRPEMENPVMPGATSLSREKYVSCTSYGVCKSEGCKIVTLMRQMFIIKFGKRQKQAYVLMAWGMIWDLSNF